MKIIKGILFIIVGIIVIILLAALFIKKEFGVEKSVVINKPTSEVYNYIKYLKNQDNYSKWNSIDPAMKKTFTGTDGTVGFIYAWDSENKDAGMGEQEITKLNENASMESEVRFKKPMENVGHLYINTDSVSANSTKVVWGMKGKNSYPMNFMNLFIPNMIGKDLETGLNNLKTLLEK